jgi:biotin carboxyl carrier protein
VPETGPQREKGTDRRSRGVSEAARRADHAGIARLADELLPALIAKLGSTELGELEVREGDWHVRLRRPYGVVPGEGRRMTDKASRAQPGHEGHGHARAAPEGHRGARSGSSGGSGGGTGTSAGGAAGAAGGSTNGTGASRTGSSSGSGSASGSRDGGDGAGSGTGDRSRSMATSPAVGIFQPGARAASGTRVRAGDVLGHVDVLGVPQDIQAPADGIVGTTLVEAGMAVEYGQELIRIELTSHAEAR